MMNSPIKQPYNYFKWQNLLILSSLLFLLVSALPNLYIDKVKFQLFPINPITQKITTIELKNLFDQHNISIDEILTTPVIVSITLDNKTDKNSVKQLLSSVYKDNYRIENSIINHMPSFLNSLNAKPIKLGLDLSGGVLFVLEVETKQALFDRLKNIALEIKTIAMEKRIRGVTVIQNNGNKQIDETNQNLIVKYPNSAIGKIDYLFNQIEESYPELAQRKDNSNQTILSFSSKKTAQFRQETMKQTLKTMRGRIEELGITEAVTLQQGKNHIRIELPGVNDPETLPQKIDSKNKSIFLLKDPLP